MSRRRAATSAAVLALAAAGVAACGEQEVELNADRGDNASIKRGAELFHERCSGCHTLSAAATEGSNNSVKYQERTDGPSFDQRTEQVDQVLYAIRNGGFSGAIMPQNIVVGQEAQDVAEFVAAYSGSKAKRPPAPETPGSTTPARTQPTTTQPAE
jgi:mono/diheme cytochrome c family protein